MDTCKECRSINLVLCQRDGDIVCTSCGLVQEAHVIDDTLYGNTTYGNMESVTIHYEKLQKYKHNKNDLFSKASIYILGDEFDNIISEARALYSAISQLHKGRHNKALCCACFLYACKNFNAGVEPSKVYAFFDVRLWLHYSKLSFLIEQVMNQKHNVNKVCNYTDLKRMVYECHLLNKQQACQVIHVATQLYNKIQCLTSKVKTSKMNASLIYISCLINKYNDVSLEFVSKFYNVSIATLKKHETLIQTVLKNG
jgi:transcription initiation factor TFIIIB Brf1 subunit/transcription initiation factor TFIIB